MVARIKDLYIPHETSIKILPELAAASTPVCIIPSYLTISHVLAILHSSFTSKRIWPNVILLCWCYVSSKSLNITGGTQSLRTPAVTKLGSCMPTLPHTLLLVLRHPEISAKMSIKGYCFSSYLICLLRVNTSGIAMSMYRELQARRYDKYNWFGSLFDVRNSKSVWWYVRHFQFLHDSPSHNPILLDGEHSLVRRIEGFSK